MNLKLDSWVQKYSAAGAPLAAPSWPRTHNGVGNGDDIVNGLVTDANGNIYAAGGETIVTNALFPVLHGGLQPNVTWTVGVEFNF